MTRRIDQREECIERLSAYVLEAGLSRTSLRQLAEAANVSDRMLLYYFKNKSEIMTAVLLRSAADMAAALNEAIPEGLPMSAGALLAKGAALTGGDVMRPYMRLSLEISAYAGRNEEPYASAAKAIIDGFIGWVETRLDTPDPEKRKAQAIMILAVIDGFGILAVGTEPDALKGALGEITQALM